MTTEETLTFPSKSGGKPHTVTVHEMKAGGRYVTCDCVAGRHAHGTKPGCHAMKRARVQLGIPPVVGVTTSTEAPIEYAPVSTPAKPAKTKTPASTPQSPDPTPSPAPDLFALLDKIAEAKR